MRAELIRAVSPVMAAILLVVISVAAAVLVWTWLHGVAAAKPTEAALQEMLVIDAAYYNASGNTVDAYVRNVGCTPVTISSVYVLDTSGNVICALANRGVEISPGKVVKISVSCYLSSGTYELKVVSSHGIDAVYRFHVS